MQWARGYQVLHSRVPWRPWRSFPCVLRFNWSPNSGRSVLGSSGRHFSNWKAAGNVFYCNVCSLTTYIYWLQENSGEGRWKLFSNILNILICLLWMDWHQVASKLYQSVINNFVLWSIAFIRKTTIAIEAFGTLCFGASHSHENKFYFYFLPT